MSEALARVRNEVLSRRVDLKRAGGTLARKFPPRFFSLSGRAYAVIALSALVAGIAVNALVLQRGRHPAPLFSSGAPAPAPVTIRLQNPPPAPPAPAPRPAVEAAPPQAASDAPAAVESAPIPPPAPRHASASGKHDPIGDLLHQEKTTEDAHLLQSARSALVKLGYPVKGEASDAAVHDAIREFERAHGLPPSSEVTPRLVKRLNEAAKSAAH